MKRALLGAILAIGLVQAAAPARADHHFPTEYETAWALGDNFVNCGWDILYAAGDEQEQSFLRTIAQQGGDNTQRHWGTVQGVVRPVTDPVAREVQDVDDSIEPTFNEAWATVEALKCFIVHGTLSPILYEHLWSQFLVKCTFISTLTCGINVVGCNALMPTDVLIEIFDGEDADPRLYAPADAPATPVTRPWTECPNQWSPPQSEFPEVLA